MKKNTIWHISNKLLETNPKDVVKKILEDDKANYERASKELSGVIELLNSSMILFIASVQGAHKRIEHWKGDVSVRAGMAMAEATFNYALLARHSVLLGYISEAEALFRSCYERTTRSLLFFANSEMATRFLEGKKIGQAEVEYKIAELEIPGKKEKLYESLREMYGHTSEVVHPNLKSFELRYGMDKNLQENVGLKPAFGGILNDVIAQAVIGRVIHAMLFILKVIRMKFAEESGEWDKEFKRIYDNNQALLDKLISELN